MHVSPRLGVFIYIRIYVNTSQENAVFKHCNSVYMKQNLPELEPIWYL